MKTTTAKPRFFWHSTSEGEMLNNLRRSQEFRFSVTRFSDGKIRFADKKPRLSYASQNSAWDNELNQPVSARPL
jgi:hypothetical protein